MSNRNLITKNYKNLEKMADLFKMLGHPFKLLIFQHLCECGCQKMRVKDIYEDLGMQQATASRHLNALKKHDLLSRIVEDGKVYYFPNLENNMVGCISQCFTRINN